MQKPTNEQAAKLRQLVIKRDAAFRLICAQIANDLGLGKYDLLSSSDRKKVDDEAEEASNNWMEAAADNEHLFATTPLQKLLAEHHEVSEQILDLQEEIHGLGE